MSQENNSEKTKVVDDGMTGEFFDVDKYAKAYFNSNNNQYFSCSKQPTTIYRTSSYGKMGGKTTLTSHS